MGFFFTFLIASFEAQKFLILVKSDFSGFSLVAYTFDVRSQTPSPDPGMKTYPSLRFRGSLSCWLALGSSIHWRSMSILFPVETWLSQHHLLKRPLSPCRRVLPLVTNRLAVNVRVYLGALSAIPLTPSLPLPCRMWASLSQLRSEFQNWDAGIFFRLISPSTFWLSLISRILIHIL